MNLTKEEVRARNKLRRRATPRSSQSLEEVMRDALIEINQYSITLRDAKIVARNTLDYVTEHREIA